MNLTATLKAVLTALTLAVAVLAWSAPAEAGASTGTWRNGMRAGPYGPGYYGRYGGGYAPRRYYASPRSYGRRGYYGGAGYYGRPRRYYGGGPAYGRPYRGRARGYYDGYGY
jgi:hypothetical protein